MNAQRRLDPEHPPSAIVDSERARQERDEAITSCNARRAALGLPPLEPEKIARFVMLDEEIAARAAASRRYDEQKQAERKAAEQQATRSAAEILAARIDGIKKAAQEREATPAAPEGPQRATGADIPAQEKQRKIVNLPIIPTTARAVVNEIASSALFAAIQGKDRTILNDEPIAATGDTQIFFSGEQLNQDDHDAFMLLVFLASTKPAGEYVTVSAYSLLKALGRDTGGKQHQQIDAEIKRLTKATVEIRNNRFTYIGHLIHDAVKHEETKHWIYALNEKLVTLYSTSCYTLIDWEQRKRLKGKDLARWLQLEIARHAAPFPIKVETLQERCGSQAKELRVFRQSLKQALVALQAEGHIAAWFIDENDLVHIDRGAALTASQRRSLALPKPRGKEA